MDNKLGKEAVLDTRIASGLIVAGLSGDQGLQSIQQVLQGAKDPAAALSHVVFMAIEKVKQKLEQQGMAVDDKVWMAKGGVLDRILFDIVGLLYGVVGFEQAADPKFVTSLKQGIIDLMSEADAQEEAGGQPEQADQDQAPQQGLLAPQQQQMGGM